MNQLTFVDGTFRTSLGVLTMSVVGEKADVVAAQVKVRKRPRSKHFAARILLEVFDVFRDWLPVGIASPLLDARRLRSPIADAKQDRPTLAVDELMQFARRMHAERTRNDVNGAARDIHFAFAGNAQVYFGAVRMRMMGADLTWLPAND